MKVTFPLGGTQPVALLWRQAHAVLVQSSSDAEPQAVAIRRPSWNPPRLVQQPLSAREREVLSLLAQGFTTDQIAIQLGIGRSTVTSHRRSIQRKWGARSPAAVHLANHEGFLGARP
jgi:DNA-binding CsgD family transcriptional regulator